MKISGSMSPVIAHVCSTCVNDCKKGDLSPMDCKLWNGENEKGKENELGPCPFCGVSGSMARVLFFDPTSTLFVQCVSCMAQGPAVFLPEGTEDPTEADRKAAIRAWNTRPADDNLKGG